MSFETILADIVEDCTGALGAALMGNDGIPIAQVERPDARLPSGDVTTAGVELGRVLEEIRKAADSLEAGALAETVVVTARLAVILRAVDADLFLVVAMAPDGNLGKARYRARRSIQRIREQL